MRCYSVLRLVVILLVIAFAERRAQQTELPAQDKSAGGRQAERANTRGPGEFAVQTNRRPRTAIVNAPVVAAKDVTDQVNGHELVLGVVIENQPRAYPINQLTGPSREIINDTLGGRPIAATW